ncbi:hypothetical protein WUBG_11171, partial [Wuchereria bancrofti]
ESETECLLNCRTFIPLSILYEIVIPIGWTVELSNIAESNPLENCRTEPMQTN